MTVAKSMTKVAKAIGAHKQALAVHPAQAAIDRANAAPAPKGKRNTKGAAAASVALMASVVPIGHKTTDSEKATIRVQAGYGEALAERVFASVVESSKSLKEFAADVFKLENPGRKVFRATLNKHKKEAREQEAALKTGRMPSSAFVRISELMTLSAAADKGMKMHDVEKMWTDTTGGADGFKTLGYAFIIKAARIYNASSATNGPTARQGRVAMTASQKFTRYVLTTFAPDILKELAAEMAKLARKVHSAEDVAKMLATTKAPAPAAVAAKAA